MTYISYSDRLKDPRWQRRRLEMLQAADFSCSCCDSKVKTLHVHHPLYRKGAMPWEYEDHELEVLCEDCHEAGHELKKQLDQAYSMLDTARRLQLLGYLHGLRMGYPPKGVIPVIDGEHATGLGDYYGIGYVGVMELMRDDKSLHTADVIKKLGI